MERWTDRVAVVTGASEGIGEAIAWKLAEKGMKVVAIARRKEPLDKLKEDVNVKYPGSCYVQVCDVTDENQVRKVFDWVKEKFGFASVLVNNAGVAETSSFMDLDLEGARRTFDINVLGVLNCTQKWINLWKEANSEGHIFNINSIVGHMDIRFPGFDVYKASKHALTSLTRSIHRELDKAKSKIRITSVSPGLVRTATTSMIISKNQIPFIQPEDVADVVVYALTVPFTVNVSEVTVEPTHGRMIYE